MNERPLRPPRRSRHRAPLVVGAADTAEDSGYAPPAASTSEQVAAIVSRIDSV